MDQRLLELYNTELRHIRQMGAEFAREYPKIAGRLALDKEGKEICPDPFVERLLEGFAFLAARVHLKLDAEFPRFTQSLLETVYPQYLSPTPSMAIVRFEPDLQESALADGYLIPRGSVLRGLIGRNERTACEYRTAHPVTLYPVKLVEARYFTRDVALLELPPSCKARAAIRLRLELPAEMSFKTVKLNRLPMFLYGEGDIPGLLFEQLCAHATSVALRESSQRGPGTWRVLPRAHLRRAGISSDESLLPVAPSGFEGYRLLREYFAFPQRFLFVELTDLQQAVMSCDGRQLDLVVPLSEQETHLENRVDASCFGLYCTPVINLFPKRADRILLSDKFAEFQIIVDRTRPLDFEVFAVDGVTGYGALTGQTQEFRSFYRAQDRDAHGGAFFSVQRVPRLITDRERQYGQHSKYTGSEVYLSLVDAQAAPYRSDLRELEVRVLCTNRHLPIQMAIGQGPTDFNLEVSAPVLAVRCLGVPSRPLPSIADGEMAWRLISHLTLNYLSLLDADAAQGAVALRDLLRLYTDSDDKALRKQIEGLRSARCAADVQRVETAGPVAFARGLRIELLFDEQAFEGLGCFVLGSVLEQFFARYVSLNSFTRTLIRTEQRGEIMVWPAQMGRRQII